VLAVPAIVLFWLMMRSGLVDASVGTAATIDATNPAAKATPNSRTPPSDRDS
jgi:PAT family beta-lactamase induction signal transducer AmpG